MIQQVFGLLGSFFSNPITLGIGLAIIFGAIWLTCYWPPLFRKPWFWAILVGGAIMMLIAVLIDISLQFLSGQVMTHFWSFAVIQRWYLYATIVQIFLSGLVQEGGKLVPVVIYWWRKGRKIEPKLGLIIGAIAGAGFAIFEAQGIFTSAFASGWNWALATGGFIALYGFLERFFFVAFHVASCALAGWGLAKGWGWQFWLLASFLHAMLYWGILFSQQGFLSLVQAAIFVAIFALLVAGAALWLRWRKALVSA
jgi:RsiW-degrading membrane proteinase PrsW (M82 family)